MKDTRASSSLASSYLIGLVLLEPWNRESHDGQAGHVDLVGGEVHLGDHNVGVVL